MKFTELLKVALEGLTTNKARSLLTMLGVIIGVAAVIVMRGVSAGTEQTIADQINSLGANLLFVSGGFSGGGPGAAREQMQLGLVYSDVDAIAGLSGVAGVSVEQRTSQLVKYNGVAVDSVNVMGVTPDFPSVREVEVAEGRFFNSTEVDRKTKVAVIGSSLATELFGSADPIGEKITVGDTKLTIIGVMAPKGTTGGEDWDERIYTPITVVFQKWNWDRMAAVTGYRVNTIYVQVAEDADMDKVAEQIELLLVKRHDTTLEDSPYEIATQSDIIETQASTTAAFRSLLGWVAGVSLVVGGIGIMNIMLVSVTERTRRLASARPWAPPGGISAVSSCRGSGL
jgi:putative ABC transport system permease protein